MKTTWTKGLNAEQKKEISASFNACADIRSRLTDLINEKIATKRKDAVSVDKYSSPSWAYLQADAVGYERAMNEIISLLSSTSVEKE